MKKLTAWLVIAMCLLLKTLATDEIVIDLEEQTLYLQRNGNLMMVAPATTGSIEFPTPEGTFEILEKFWERDSKEFNSKMLRAQMISRKRGIFIHHGFLFGIDKEDVDGSHACIRLNFLAANALYEQTRIGCKVRIVKSLPDDLVATVTALRAMRTYYRGKTEIFFERLPEKVFAGAPQALAPELAGLGSAKAVLNPDPKHPDEIAISDNLVALVMGKVAVTALRPVFPNVDERIKLLVSQDKYKKSAMVHLVKPGQGNIEGSLWYFGCGKDSVTITMEDFNLHLGRRGLPPMTEAMFKK